MINVFFDSVLDYSFLPQGCQKVSNPREADIALFANALPHGFSREETPDIHLVLCVERDRINRLDNFRDPSDIWILPIVPELWRMRLENLARTIRNDRDAAMEKSWLETLIDSMPDMIWFKSLDGLHMKVNQAFCKAAGKTRRMIEGRDHYFIWNVDKSASDYDETCVNSEAEVIKANKTCVFNEILKIGDEKRHLITYKTPIHDRYGKIVGTVGIAHDVTNMLNLNREMEIFLEAMPFPLLMQDRKGVSTHANTKFSDFFQERKSDIIGTAYADWKKWFFENEDGCLSFADKKGEKHYVGVRETELRDVFGNLVGGIAVFSDITAEKNLENEIRRNAFEDHLTGLANRRALGQYFENLKETFNLLYIDLDNFKSVNDKFGHEAGDAALREISKIMRMACPNDFLARLGGDEFLIVRKDGKLDEIAEKIQSDFREWIKKDERFADVGLSIGVRENCGEEPIDQLIHEADQDMYRVKRERKNSISLS